VHTLVDQDKKTLQSLRNLLDLGSNLAGGSIGAAAGLIAGGPAGAIAGGMAGTVVGHVLKSVGKDFAVRFLSPNEQKRIGGVVIRASEKIEENLRNGKQIRQDDFFHDKPKDRSAAKEIAEGILLASQREYQEKKIEFYGNLLGNIAFTVFSREHANLCIKISQELSYRQLCLLSMFRQKDNFKLRQYNYHETKTISVEAATLLEEIFDLDRRNLLTQGNVLLGITDVIPAKIVLDLEGTRLFHLMELSKISPEELIKWARLLQ
jgi:hypothetical protein